MAIANLQKAANMAESARKRRSSSRTEGRPSRPRPAQPAAIEYLEKKIQIKDEVPAEMSFQKHLEEI
jgi:hypothetical protein